MSFLTRMFAKTTFGLAERRFVEAARSPVETQLRLLREIAERNRDTEYGKMNRFSSIRSFEDWRSSVPVVTYERIEPRIERMARGERNVLTAEDPVMFSLTSGTTGRPKLVPVTPSCRKGPHADQMKVWMSRALADHPTLLDGKIVSFVSRAEEGRTPAGIPYGSTSGHIYKSMSRAVRDAYAAPYEVFEIEDYLAQYYAILRVALARDVSFVATANPSTIVKMCSTADAEAESLIRDIRDGTLKDDIDVPADIRAALAPHCRPAPDRARALEAARASRGGKLLPADYWPNLALIGCWKGGTVGSYVKQFPEWFDPDGRREVPVRDWGYLSSEARCSVPLRDDGDSGVLSLASNVYEFVDAEDVEERPDDWATWKYLGVGDIEPGHEYYVVLTTTGGLYRYEINDVVEVTGYFERTPEIAFRRKGRGVTSLTGEKVTVNQIIEAFEKASTETGARPDYFKAEADAEASRYVFKIESKEPWPGDARTRFLESLDRSLRSLNLEYEAKRASQRLHAPRLLVMKSGWYDDKRRELADEGKNVFQAKTVVLATRTSSARNEREKRFLEAEVTLEPEMA